MPAADELIERFVILSTQRSGSNWLEDRLGGHQLVTMYREEVFRRTLSTPIAYRSFRDTSPPARWLGSVVPPIKKYRYLRWLQQSAPSRAPVVAFRLMYDQLRRNPSVGVLLAATRTPVVHLVRENVLATHVSVVAARQSGLYVTRSAEKKSPAVVLDTSTLVAELERRSAIIERHRRVLEFVPHIEVRFADLTSNPVEGDREILEFLRLPSAELGSQVRRTGDRPLEERILNVADVRAVLEGSRYAKMLDT